jgi:predicted nucleotidyltransferase
MKIGMAKNIAAKWVNEIGSKGEDFLGAYISGSTAEMADDAELPETSDVDIIVVTGKPTTLKLGKFKYEGILLEVTQIPQEEFASVEEVLISHHLANSLKRNTILLDPTGYLTSLQSQVSKHFAEKEWVIRRCRNVLDKIESSLKGIDTTAPYYDLVTQWLFPTGITTHVLLLAALRNPTVRRRYQAVKEVLGQYGYDAFYQKLLELLGCKELKPQSAKIHLKNLEKTYDAAVKAARTPFPFREDITVKSKIIAIDGSYRFIEEGYHREAVFWMVATYARCHKILAADAPAGIQKELLPDFKNFMQELGISSDKDIINRRERVIQFLPELWNVTEEIIDKNPGIITT